MTKRILLHILCMLLDHEWRWHWAGIRRELRHKAGANPEATLLNGEKSKSETLSDAGITVVMSRDVVYESWFS